jgi:hypothetical protein
MGLRGIMCEVKKRKKESKISLCEEDRGYNIMVEWTYRMNGGL